MTDIIILQSGTGIQEQTFIRGEKINQQTADQYFTDDLAYTRGLIARHVKVPLTNNQYDALVSLGYNCPLALKADSTLVTDLNKKDYQSAANDFLLYDHANVPKKGLVYSDGLHNRRLKEQAIFLTADSSNQGAGGSDSDGQRRAMSPNISSSSISQSGSSNMLPTGYGEGDRYDFDTTSGPQFNSILGPTLTLSDLLSPHPPSLSSTYGLSDPLLPSLIPVNSAEPYSYLPPSMRPTQKPASSALSPLPNGDRGLYEHLPPSMRPNTSDPPYKTSSGVRSTNVRPSTSAGSSLNNVSTPSGLARASRAKGVIQNLNGYKAWCQSVGVDPTDCGRFVAHVMKAYDPNYKTVSTPVQFQYVKDHPELYDYGVISSEEALWRILWVAVKM